MTAFSTLLLGALAVLLVVAAIGDWRARTIPNWLTGAIALMAPAWWYATGLHLWPDVPLQILIASIALLSFAAIFAMGAMGGGDVKLIAALGLWFGLVRFVNLLMAMAIIGGVLTIVLLVRHKLRRDAAPLEVPYGIAIALAGLWMLFRTIS